jgi:hypothetical protein
MQTKTIRPTTLGAVSLGEKFVFRTAEIVGEDVCTRKMPFEGRVVTVVGFKPRYVNQIVVQDPNGYQCLLPLDMVEKALRLQEAHQPEMDESGSIHPPSTTRTI